MPPKNGPYIEAREGARTLPDEIKSYLTEGTDVIVFLMPGYGRPDKPIKDKMARDCFTCDLGAGSFDVLPLHEHGCGYYGQFEGKRDKGVLAEAVGTIYDGKRQVYAKKAWKNHVKLKPKEILDIIRESR